MARSAKNWVRMGPRTMDVEIQQPHNGWEGCIMFLGVELFWKDGDLYRLSCEGDNEGTAIDSEFAPSG